MKQSKLNFKKKRPGKAAWETDSEDDDRGGGSDSDPETSSPTRVREGGRRAAGESGVGVIDRFREGCRVGWGVSHRLGSASGRR